MAADAIEQLPVGELAACHAHLFLWITGPCLVRGMHLPVMRAWGFEPSSIAFVWIKPKRKAFANGGFFLDETLFAKGMGHTTRQNAEYVVLGRRGKPRRLRKDVHQLIIQPRREHSRKPDELYARVERYCTGPYLELFARQRRPGWDCLGQRDRQVRTRIRRPRRLRQIARGGLSRHSRARCGRRPEVGAEMTRRKQPEAQLQRALIQHLRWGARGDTWWTHIPNGGWRSPTEAAIFKSLGVRAGSPDLLIIRAGQPLFMELKAPGRKLSPAQVECHAALQRAGAQIETVDNIDAALAFLCRLGVLR